MNLLSNLKNRLRWWYAKRYGEHPVCEECGAEAMWYTTWAGYLCWRCVERGGPGSPVGAIRDIKPTDWLEDDPGWDA